MPRDRNGSFKPQILPQARAPLDRLRRQDRFDVRARHVDAATWRRTCARFTAWDVSATLISQVTEEVMVEVRVWQRRPLEPLYLIVYLDALVVKLRQEAGWRTGRCFVAIGVTREGSKEVLGLWTSATEGAKLWLQILTEIRNRGVADILIACVYGLKGLPGSDRDGVPTHRGAALHCAQGAQQSGVCELERTQGGVAEDLRGIQRAPTAEAGMAARDSFEERWNSKYAAIGKLWRWHWAGISPQFAYPEEIRRAIYTTTSSSRCT